MITAAAIIVILALSAYLFYASYYIGSGVYLKAVCKLPAKDKTFYLTFDDGPSPQTEAVLRILAQHNATAAFFLIGANAEANPEAVKAIAAAGHLIGNHSYCHKGTFPLMSSNKIAADINRCSQVLATITGKAPQLFRPPFGVTNPLIAKGLKKTGAAFTTIGWDVRSFDTMGGDANQIADKITSQLQPGSIVLLHDRMPFSPQLLEKLLTQTAKEGWKVGEAREMAF